MVKEELVEKRFLKSLIFLEWGDICVYFLRGFEGRRFGGLRDDKEDVFLKIIRFSGY